jgi:hypothetical protein
MLLVGEIDDSGHTAVGSRQCTGVIVMHADRTHERVIVVDVDVNGARQNQQPTSVQDNIGLKVAQVPDSSDALSLNEDVLLGNGLPQHDGATPDQC